MRKFSLCLFIVLVVSCAAQEPVVIEEEEKPEEIESVTELFEPLSLLKNDVVVEPPEFEVKKIDYESLIPVELKIDTSQKSLDELVWGWRVQIGIYIDLDYVIEISDKAGRLLDERVYLDFDAPFHKVRVGDCFLRKDANELLEKVRRAGFYDAFIMPTMVYKYPELRRQREEERRRVESDSVNVEINQEPDSER